MHRILKHIFLLTVVLFMSALSGCQDEKELIIYDGDLPIKTTAVYIIGSAGPSGWNIDSPQALEQSTEDPYIFIYDGLLNPGELKFSIAKGDWGVPFIRPMAAGTVLGKEPVVNEPFQVHAGDDPDEKWVIEEMGMYTLTFNLRTWTMSSTYNGGLLPPEVYPIETEHLYLVGGAAPAGWNIDAPTECKKTAPYIFEYEGYLDANGNNDGEFKVYLNKGNWNDPGLHPLENGVEISSQGVSDENFVYRNYPDDKWKVTETGYYHLVFDLEHWTMSAEMTEAPPVNPDDKQPIETFTVYMIGWATPAQWNLDQGVPMTRSEEDNFIFTYDGELAAGSLRFCLNNAADDWAQNMIRPMTDKSPIGKEPITDETFSFHSGLPDNNWDVIEAGHYTITLNLRDWTISTKYHNADEPVNPEVEPIETEAVYMLGWATTAHWEIENGVPMTRSAEDKYIFTYEGHLDAASLRFHISNSDWSVPAIRPIEDQTSIGPEPIVDQAFAWVAEPDYNWMVTVAGTFKITLNLRNRTLSTEYLEIE